jgi:hypothetical protein
VDSVIYFFMVKVFVKTHARLYILSGRVASNHSVVLESVRLEHTTSLPINKTYLKK